MRILNRGRGRPKSLKSICDLGTLELQKKRKSLVQNEGHEHLSESLLGLLLAKNLISQKYYEAGIRYYKLGYAYEPQLRLGLGHRQSILANLGQPHSQNLHMHENESAHSKDEKITRRWKMATDALKNAGLRPFTLVTHILFSGIDPKEMGAQFLKKITPRDLLETKDGLLALANYFRI